jgi:hypothetical protein
MNMVSDDYDDYGALSHHYCVQMHENSPGQDQFAYEESAASGKGVMAAVKGATKALTAAGHAAVGAGKSAAHAVHKAEHAAVGAGKSAAHAVHKAEASVSNSHYHNSKSQKSADSGAELHPTKKSYPEHVVGHTIQHVVSAGENNADILKTNGTDIEQNNKDDKHVLELLAEIAVIHSRHAQL